MLTVLLALTGAVVYGAADFLGGLAARTTRAVAVAAAAAAVGLLPLLVGALVVGAVFSGPAVLVGAAAGVSGSVAVLLLYRALAVGPMSVLSPLTAVFAAVTPVVVALVGGTVLSVPAWAALVVAVLAVVLVAAVREPSGARVTVGGVVTAAVAGCGFGGIVLAYDAVPEDAGVASLLVARVVQAVLLGTVAVVVALRPGGTTDPVTPAHPVLTAAPTVRRSARWSPRLVVTVAACGVLDALANACIQAALHLGRSDAALPVVSVLNALYPVGTVVLAGIVLRERLTAVQWTGIVLAFGASVGLALA
ncbi:EamA family transporter [Curtobacterium sp. MCSS17_007]|uniref:EamA family transporter n=1 Tax=Curtobacterium sp. MCSS17_007 TaxID=2175646 RepID=UPI000DB74900|nr:EamA family transporter [Curtobacterium sp. MCSS17_007]WIE76209.1 EamA family transporter [Curtobacterium sp. MCSS17_007]